jgi:hypothetical protein
MQFVGGKGITLFVAIVLIACGVGFGSGLLVGRQFPVHRFERFGESRFLLDPTTGRVCDPFKNPSESGNPIDQTLANNASPIRDANGFQLAKPVSNYPPPCGK